MTEVDAFTLLTIPKSGDFTRVYCMLLCRELGYIISGHRDGVIRIFNPGTGVLVKERSLNGIIYHMIKDFSKNVNCIIVGTSSGEITMLRVPSLKTEKEFKRGEDDSTIYRFLKIDHDLFLSSCGSAKLRLWSASQAKELKQLPNTQDLSIPYDYGYSKLVKSRNFEKCFYMNINTDGKPIHLINYENDCFEKILGIHTSSKDVNTCTPIINALGEEMVFCANDDGQVYVYNVGKSLSEKKIELVKCLEFEGQGIVLCCKIFQNAASKNRGTMFLGCGDGKLLTSKFEIIDKKAENSENSTIISNCFLFKKEIHSDWVRDIKLMTTQNNLFLFTCSNDGSIKSLRIGGIQVLDEYIEKMKFTDCHDRVNFLIDQIRCGDENTILRNDKIKSKMKIKIVIKKSNVDLFMFRSFLVLPSKYFKLMLSQNSLNSEEFEKTKLEIIEKEKFKNTLTEKLEKLKKEYKDMSEHLNEAHNKVKSFMNDMNISDSEDEGEYDFIPGLD